MTETNITLFGDSVGKGICTDNGKIEIIKNNAVALLNKNYGLNINNRSVYGLSLKKFADRKIMDKYIETLPDDKDNVAVLELGGNDADYDWKKVVASFDSPHHPKTTVAEFGDDLNEIVNKLNRAKVKTYFCTITPISSERYFYNVISKIVNGQTVLDFFHGDINTIYRHHEIFSDVLLRVAIKNDIELIDLRRAFLQSEFFGDLMCSDGIHPNEKGQYLIYNTVTQLI